MLQRGFTPLILVHNIVPPRKSWSSKGLSSCYFLIPRLSGDLWTCPIHLRCWDFTVFIIFGLWYNTSSSIFVLMRYCSVQSHIFYLESSLQSIAVRNHFFLWEYSSHNCSRLLVLLLISMFSYLRILTTFLISFDFAVVFLESSLQLGILLCFYFNFYPQNG